MVKILTVHCPHCHQVSDIYLSTNACVIVLNCPTCSSPIMYFEKKIFLLSKKQVDEIKDTTHNAAIMRMLDRIAHPEEPTHNNAKKITLTHSSSSSYQQVQSSSRALDFSDKHFRDNTICGDDLTNLRIELALCNDSQQFIDTM